MEDLTKKRFDIIDGGLVCVLFVALQYVFYFIISMAPWLISDTISYIVMSVVLEGLFVVAVVTVAASRRKAVVPATTMNKKVNWAMVGMCALVSVVCIVLFSDLSNAFAYTLEAIGYRSTSEIVSLGGVFGYLINIVTVCAVPALCEELMFRGVVLNSFRGYNKWIGISVSAVAFMLMHGNPEQTIHQLLLGFVLGYIVWETRNIWASILIHFFNNFFAITLSFIMSLVRQNSGEGSGTPETITSGQIAMAWIMGIGLAIIGIIVVWWITKYLKKQSQKTNGEAQPVQEVSTIEIDGEKTEVEAVVSEGGKPAEAVGEEKQNPTPAGKYLTIVSYICFAAYFVYEWVRTLIYHL